MASKRVPCLRAPGIGIVLNSECATRRKAEIFLMDRRANGDAFPGEYVYMATERDYRAAHHFSVTATED